VGDTAIEIKGSFRNKKKRRSEEKVNTESGSIRTPWGQGGKDSGRMSAKNLKKGASRGSGLRLQGDLKTGGGGRGGGGGGGGGGGWERGMRFVIGVLGLIHLLSGLGLRWRAPHYLKRQGGETEIPRQGQGP